MSPTTWLWMTTAFALYRKHPPALSAWQFMHVEKNELQLDPTVTPYDLRAPLFSDYTHKLRTLWMPDGTSAAANQTGDIDFPVGTVFSKTFFYPRQGSNLKKTTDTGSDFRPDIGNNGGLDLADNRLLETRLLMRRSDGWVALPYLWNDAQTDATLVPTGAILDIELEALKFHYIVPDKNQCAGCHATDHASRTIKPIGPTLANLDRDFLQHPDLLRDMVQAENGAPINQLTAWRDAGLLADTTFLNAYLANGEAMTDWRDTNADVTHRARAYLHINCGHCHNKTGPADTSGLHLDITTRATEDAIHLGRCKPPVAAGQGTGGYQYAIVPGQPEISILIYRMQSLDPGAMMPEVGRSTVHHEGVALVSDWIASLPGHCG